MQTMARRQGSGNGDQPTVQRQRSLFHIAIALYVLLGTSYLLLLPLHPYPGSSLLKALPALLMAALFFIMGASSHKSLMGLGYLFAAAGDVALDLGRKAYFKEALCFFLITQVAYSVAFSQEIRWRLSRLWAFLPILIYAFILTTWLLPRLGPLKIPVLVYILGITSMGFFATFSQRPLPTVYLGALLFILADSLIAIDRFIVPIPQSLYWIISLYLLAQLRIGTALLNEPRTWAP